jgi:hypothetical protein
MKATVRVLLVMVMMCMLTLPASAEPCGPGGPLFAVAPGSVKITLRSGNTLKSTILCVGADTIVLSDGRRIRQLPLADVVRIVKPRDSVVNGFFVGALVGVLLAGLSGGGGEAEPEGVVLAFGAFGAVIDAFRGSSWTVYTAPSVTTTRRTVEWRVRF